MIVVVSVCDFGLLTIPILGFDGGANGARTGAGVGIRVGVTVGTGAGVGVGVGGGLDGGGLGGGGLDGGGLLGGIQFLTALALFACPGAAVPVVRVSDSPPTESVVEAWIVSVPPADDVIVAEHAPLTVVHPLPPTNDPTEPDRSANPTDVPFGAAT